MEKSWDCNMSWTNLSSQAQGNIGMGRAIAYFTSKGHTVSIPLNDCQEYDLIVDTGTELLKVQVKTSRHKAPSGNFRVSLVSSGGSKRSIYHRVCEGKCDLLFIATEDGLDYLYKVGSLPRKAITVNPKDALK